MTLAALQQFSELTNIEIIATYYPNQKCRWCVHLDHVEIKDGGCLVSTHGNATSIEEAAVDYWGQIKGRQIIHRAGTDERQAFRVPA